MSEKLYRCGWCGQPTNKDGEPLTISQIELVKDLKRWDEAEQTPGECCRHTREMDLDDCDIDS